MWILNAVKMFVCGEITAKEAKEMVNQMDKKFNYNMEVMAMQATDNKDKLNVEQEFNTVGEDKQLQLYGVNKPNLSMEATDNKEFNTRPCRPRWS